MMEANKYALIVANSRYDDAVLRQLVAPPQDAEALSEALADPTISGFNVQTLIDAPSYKVCEEIESFLEDRERDHLSLIYFSGHGITDDGGLLYYAASNTLRKKLRSTGVAFTWVNEMMSRCRSRRQVLLLDCCHSGAFARTKSGGSVNVGQQLAAEGPEDGRGRFVLTASDAFQYSFEGDAVEGQGVYSVFTQALVQGLRTGEADLDGDGSITLDELYQYVHRRVKEKTPQQSPRKWESDAEGSLVIALNPQPAEAELPQDLLDAIRNFHPEPREKAVARLELLLRGKHRGLALAARNSLRALADDDSRRVSTAASQALSASPEDSVPIVHSPGNTIHESHGSSREPDRRPSTAPDENLRGREQEARSKDPEKGEIVKARAATEAIRQRYKEKEALKETADDDELHRAKWMETLRKAFLLFKPARPWAWPIHVLFHFFLLLALICLATGVLGHPLILVYFAFFSFICFVLNRCAYYLDRKPAGRR